jgi:hypothetical protein
MTFGTSVLIVLAAWSVLSILVSIGVGAMANGRNAEPFQPVDRPDVDRRATDRIAS